MMTSMNSSRMKQHGHAESNQSHPHPLLGLFLGLMLFSTGFSSQAAEPKKDLPATPPTQGASEEQQQTDKIDVGNLEQKYWSAKDDDFTVVQNRTYTKNKKIFISLMSGRIVNDGFVEGSPNSYSIGYFFNEKNGLSLDATQFSTHENSVTKQFVTRYGTAPAYNKPLNTYSLTYMWSPIYAKVSLLEKKILYLDLSIGAHIGITKYQNMTFDGGSINSTPHYGLDISQLWFLSRSLALRFDVRNTWSKQKQYLYHIAKTEPDSARSLGESQLQDNTWLLGITYFFGKK